MQSIALWKKLLDDMTAAQKVDEKEMKLVESLVRLSDILNEEI